ncbi:alpha/beta hydrolase [Brumimicrobium mesophilum]|uniref:alpha/beta hydrolase n=1 Tax=Brumimicrobium mesophilum TaxID=392717 RepID=UPI000D13F2E5|nr:alpha/beta hydrolase [Brumimicrobium mesophilum]
MKLTIVLVILISIFSCTKKDDPLLEKPVIVDINSTLTSPPFTITAAGVKFYENIQYGPNTRNKYDLFIPESESPTGIVIFIHGGGFVAEDKSFAYTNPKVKNVINELLSENIAFATINYRLLDTDEEEGVLKSVNDSKKALQYIRFHADSYNISKEDVVLMGASAGAGASLWLALSDDMANNTLVPDVSSESTRVKGVIAVQAQGSYDIIEWPNSIFQEYLGEGFSFETIVNLLSDDVINQFYGVDSLNHVYSSEIVQERIELFKSVYL